jgi:hypothetical protein
LFHDETIGALARQGVKEEKYEKAAENESIPERPGGTPSGREGEDRYCLYLQKKSEYLGQERRERGSRRALSLSSHSRALPAHRGFTVFGYRQRGPRALRRVGKVHKKERGARIMHTKTFSGLTASQIDELRSFFGERCHSWEKVCGAAKVDFDSEAEAENFVQQYEFEED